MEAGQEKTIEDVAKKANKEIIRIKTVFPFTLFPTELIVDETKVTIIDNWFFYKHYFPILMKDIKTVRVSYNLLFASIIIEVTGYETNPLPINFLKKKQAIKAHQIIVGLTTLLKENADKSLGDMSTNSTIEILQGIGSTTAEPGHPETRINRERV